MAKEVAVKKGFIWKGLRIGFYAMIAVWIINTLYAKFSNNLDPTQGLNKITILLSLVFLILLIFNFILSIIHLVKYKSKTFAIIALVVCSIVIILNIVGFVIAILGVLGSQQINPVGAA